MLPGCLPIESAGATGQLKLVDELVVLIFFVTVAFCHAFFLWGACCFYAFSVYCTANQAVSVSIQF